VQPLWKTEWRLLIKLKIDPTIPLTGIYLKKCESDYDKGICPPMCIAALFTIAKR
jgi:hypothetical protein